MDNYITVRFVFDEDGTATRFDFLENTFVDVKVTHETLRLLALIINESLDAHEAIKTTDKLLKDLNIPTNDME